MNIVWLTNREESWEKDWIEFLFSDIPHTTITDYEFVGSPENSILVYNLTIDINKYLQIHGYNYGLIHLSDEYYKDSTEHYSLVKFVLRNYFKDCESKVLNFPLGWMQGYPNNFSEKTVFDRKRVWAFAGQIEGRPTRQSMIEAMSNVEGGTHYYRRNGEVVGEFRGYTLNPQQMGELYNDSIFVLSPRGNWNQDCFRLTEALQAGALPIVEKSDYWNQMFGKNHPLLQVCDWSAAPKLIEGLLHNKNELENLRCKTSLWWNIYCRNLKTKIANMLL